MTCLTAILAYLMTANVDGKAPDEALTDLEDLRWKHRVILVFARGAKASNAEANLRALAPEIDERDIAWFVLDGAALHTNHTASLDETLRERILERYFTPAPGDTAVLLIGKDGQVKSRSTDLDLEATFALIDQILDRFFCFLFLSFLDCFL